MDAIHQRRESIRAICTDAEPQRLAAATPEPSGAARIGPDRPLPHHDRRELLDHLGGYAGDPAWEGRRVQAILGRPRTGTATGEPDVGERVVVEVIPCELEVPDIGRALSQDPARNYLGKRAEDDTGQEMAEDVARRDWRRRQCVEDAAGRRRDMYR